MKKYLIERKKFRSLLRRLSREYELIAPQKTEQNDYLFQLVREIDEIELNYTLTSNSLKEFFFPARDKIFSYQKVEGRGFKITPSDLAQKRKRVFLGVRACDLKAVHFQDLFFSQQPKDELYWQRRNLSLIISLACQKPANDACFCYYTRSGPCLEEGEGFDLQLTELGENYLVEVDSQKGEEFIKEFRNFFKLADSRLSEKKKHLLQACLRKFSAPKYDVDKIYQKLSTLSLDELWEELGRRCTNCGGCEFICPTCFCFYTQDLELAPNRGERIRAWDSCTFEGYRRMAGGFNPSEKNSLRISRRFFCKLYNCFNWFGVFACTGCGRCSFVCPVNLDMESFIASLMKSNSYRPLLKEL